MHSAEELSGAEAAEEMGAKGSTKAEVPGMDPSPAPPALFSA